MLRRIAFVLFILGIFCPQRSKADYYGADIHYNHDSVSKYTVYIGLYVDCTDLGLWSKTLYYGKDSSQNYKTASLIFNSGRDITPLSPGECSYCKSYSSSCNFGIKMATGFAHVDLSSVSGCNIIFFWKDNYRSQNVISSPSGGYEDIYIKALLNRCSAGDHSSPYFVYDPLMFVCKDQDVSAYQPAGSDEGDSLVYKLVPALQDSNKSITYYSGYSYQQPVNCSGFFYLDYITGKFSFTPTSAETKAVAYKVEQWRRNKSGTYLKIGEVRRDAAIIVGYCSQKPPTLKYQSNIINVCANQTTKFTIASAEADDDSTFISYYGSYFPFIDRTYNLKKHLGYDMNISPVDSDVSSKPYTFIVRATNHDHPYYASTYQMFYVYVHAQPSPFTITNTLTGCGQYRIDIHPSRRDAGLSYGLVSGKDTLKQTDSSFTLNYTKNGMHVETLLLYNASGCYQKINDTINISSIPVADAGQDTGLCLGDSLQLHGTGGVTYLWSPGAKMSDSTSKDPVIWPDKATSYVLMVTDSAGCTAKDTVNVDVSNFTYTISPNVEICPNHSTRITATGPPGIKYLWYPSDYLSDTADSSVFATPKTTTTYYVQMTNKRGCYKTAHVTVSLPVKTGLGPDLTVCQGDSVQLHATGGKSYTWSLANGIRDLYTASPYVSPQSDTKYTVFIWDSAGCNWSASVNVKVKPTAFSNAGDTTICPGDTATFRASGANKYYWHLQDGTAVGNTAVIKVSPADNTTYYLDMADTTSGCSKRTSVKLWIDKDCVWPGDANVDKEVNYLDALNIGVAYGSKGGQRASVSNSWHPYLAPAWGKSTFYGVDYKHMDCNGDGVIDAKDTVAINLNYSKDSIKYISRAANADTIQLLTKFNKDTFYAGDTIIAYAYAGTPAQQAKSLYGIAFDMNYSDSLAVPGTEKATIAKDFLCPDGNCLIMPRLDVFSKELSAAFVRNNGKTISGSGIFATITYVLKDSTYHYDSTGNTLVFDKLKAKCIDSTGMEYPVSIQVSKAIVMKNHPLKTALGELSTPGRLSVYPNPANDQLNIVLTSDRMKEILLTNSVGQTVTLKTAKLTGIQNINVSSLAAGIYIVTVRSENAVYQQKVIISR